MKVRWTTDSVRTRITPDELDALTSGNTISQSLSLGDAWTITVGPALGASSLTSIGACVEIKLSVIDLETLAAPDTEGVYLKSSAPPEIRYYVEKDFPCAHPRAIEASEPYSSTFEAPEGFMERKKETS